MIKREKLNDICYSIKKLENNLFTFALIIPKEIRFAEN